MITILGTSHVSTRSQREVRAAIPDAGIVAIELDAGRAGALLTNKRATFSELRQALGVKGALLASVLRWFQEKIAKDLGVVPGIEMRAALLECKKQQKIVGLIDRPVQVTLQRLSKNFGWPEIRQMLRDFGKKQQLSIHPDDDLVAQLLEQMKDNYPRIYRVMVSERDLYMARALLHLVEQYPGQNILAIVGKAHVPGLVKQISYLNPQIAVSVWNSNPTSTSK